MCTEAWSSEEHLSHLAQQELKEYELLFSSAIGPF